MSKKLTLFSVCLTIALLLCSCSKQDVLTEQNFINDDLIGYWVNLSPIYSRLPDDSYSFLEDGIFTHSKLIDNDFVVDLSGKWALDSDNLVLTIDSDPPQTLTYSLKHVGGEYGLEFFPTILINDIQYWK